MKNEKSTRESVIQGYYGGAYIKHAREAHEFHHILETMIVNDTSCDVSSIDYDVLHGSCFGRFLLPIFINDLPGTLKRGYVVKDIDGIQIHRKP